MIYADSRVLKFDSPHELKVGDLILLQEGHEAIIFETQLLNEVSVSEDLKRAFLGQFEGKVYRLSDLPTCKIEPPLKWLNLKLHSDCS